MLTEQDLSYMSDCNLKGCLRTEDVEQMIEHIRTLQQQNEQLDKSWSDGADELNKQIEWRNKRIEKLEQQNKQMKEALESAKTYLESSPSWNARKYAAYNKIEQALLGGSSNESQ